MKNEDGKWEIFVCNNGKVTRQKREESRPAQENFSKHCKKQNERWLNIQHGKN